MKLKVGIAGYGVVGKRRRHYIDQHPMLQTVAVCDRNFHSYGTMSDGVRFYENAHQLIENEKLDILFVCLTNDVAPEATITGLTNNLHVFCEKPPGRNVSDIKNVRIVEHNNPKLKLKYGFNHRYHHSVVDAMRLIQSGELGRVLNIRGVYGKSKLITFNQTDWRTKREIAGGGILLDQGIHLIDLLRLLGGEYEIVYSIVSNEYWKYDVEDNAYALMKSSSGVVALLHSSSTQWRHRFNLDIALERGGVILTGILSGSKSYGAETMKVIWADPENDGGDPKEQTTRYNEDPSWRDEIFEFADCVFHDKPVVNGNSEDALRSMELVYRIYCADEHWKNQFDLQI